MREGPELLTPGQIFFLPVTIWNSCNVGLIHLQVEGLLYFMSEYK